MNTKTTHAFQVTALATAILAAYGSALAEGPESSVSVGIGHWSKDRPQAGIYDGMRDKGGYLLLDADVLRRDDATGTWMGLKIRDLGLDNRELSGQWQRQGDIGISLDYSRIPRDYQFNINSGVLGLGTTRQTVPTPTIVPGTGSNVELGTVRDRYTVKFFKRLTNSLNFNVSFRNEEKDGMRHWSRGGAPEFAAEPIDSTTRQLEAVLTYSRGPLQISGGYYGTSYDNANSLVVTSLSTNAVATTYNLTLPLDNKSHEFFVNGGYNFTPTTRGSFKMSYSRATQNEFLPTAAAGLVFPAGQAPIAGAPTNLNGRLDTTLLEAGLTSKPMRDLSIVANLRYRNFDDKTPLVMVAAAGGGVWNTPFSYKNKVGKLEATYRLPQGYSLLGGLEYNSQDRWVPSVGTLYVPFRAKLDEATYRVQLRKSMSETLNGSLGYAHSKRDGGGYTFTGDPVEDGVNPLNVADRKRDKWRAMVDWSPMERLGLQFSAESSRDKYSGLPFGLKEGDAQVYSVDGSFQVSKDWAINAWVSYDDTTAKETTQQTALITKYNTLTEKGTSFGLGVRGNAMAKLKVGGDLEQFHSKNGYNQDRSGGALAAGTVPIPGGITNKMLRVKLFAQYAVQKNADVRLDLIHEKWSTNDWSWMLFPGTGPIPFTYGTATDGTTVTSNPKQNSTFLGVRYRYRFE
jgi:MtrB/PioB family decaheme-associated outer membrane protein